MKLALSLLYLYYSIIISDKAMFLQSLPPKFRASGIQSLEDAIRADSPSSLNKLVIQQTLTSDQDIINGALLIMLCDSLSTHLTHFDVSDNYLGIPGALAIGSGLHHINTQQKEFYS